MNMLDLDPEVLPWSIEAESGVLGALLLNNDSWDLVGDILEPQHFYAPAHTTIFTVIGTLIVSCKPADIVTVFHELEQSGKADEVGGMKYLGDLAQYIPSAKNVKRYAEIVAERALMRGLLDAADKVKSIAVEPGKGVAQRLDEAQALLQGLQVNRGRQMPTAIDESIVKLLTRMQDMADGNFVPGISTKIPGLDRMFSGGLMGGKQIIIAARPSVGKSSFAEQICINLAMDGHPAAFFSQEMSKDELTDRAVANIGQINLRGITTGKLNNPEWSALTRAVDEVRKMPLFLDDQPALTLQDIGAKARMLKRQHGIKLIVIDYIQLCSGNKDSDSRHHQIEALSRGLKTLAKQLGISIITLSQLSREVEKRTGGRPQLSDLKESGSIEEDADIVMLLSRGSMSPDGFQIINCDIPKNRQGEVGSITLGFDGKYQKWHETAAPIEFRSPARKHYTEEV